jgi:hypothetical protein
MFIIRTPAGHFVKSAYLGGGLTKSRRFAHQWPAFAQADRARGDHDTVEDVGE